MFNPSELEGEVDHSFFDSDCEESRDGVKRVVKKTENLPATENLQTKQTGNAVDGAYLTDETKNSSRGAGMKEFSHQPEDQDGGRSFGMTSTNPGFDQNFSHSAIGEEHNSSSGKFLNLLAREEDRNEGQSSNDTEEETSRGKNSQLKNSRSKKLGRRRGLRTPSSAEASTDSEDEASYSSISGRSSLESSTLPRSDNPLSTEGRGSAVGFAAPQDLRAIRTDSEDTVTDVTPLSYASSFLQSLDLNHTEAEDGTVRSQEQGSLPYSGLSNVPQDDYSNQDVEYSLASESQLGDRMVFYSPGGRRWKNYSFTNDEVRRIDRENQRLCSQLSLLSQGSRPGSSLAQKSQRTINSPVIRLSHSALNRQREQQRIKRENLAFVKRVESVKPTPGLTRSEQLTNYQRQVGYLRGPSCPMFKKGRLTSRTASSMGVRQSSAAHHSATAVTSSGQGPSDAPVKEN